MNFRKYKLLIVSIFLGIFLSKMMISAAPVFFQKIDQDFMVSVIMQLENENHGEENGKSLFKYAEHKIISFKHEFHQLNINLDCGVPSSFIEHSRRYVDPYHPSVPTPPPNFS